MKTLQDSVDELLHVLEYSFLLGEVWRQPYDDLYMSPRSGRSAGKDSHVAINAGPALAFNTEPGVAPEELEPLPTDEAPAADSHKPASHLDDAGNEVPDKLTDTDDLPGVDIDRPLLVTFGKELRYAPTLREVTCCRRHGDGTLQSISLPRVVSNMPYPSSLRGTYRGLHRHYRCKDLTSTAMWAAAY